MQKWFPCSLLVSPYFSKIKDIFLKYIFLINKNLPRVGACVHRWNVSQYIWLDAGDYIKIKDCSGNFKYLKGHFMSYLFNKYKKTNSENVSTPKVRVFSIEFALKLRIYRSLKSLIWLKWIRKKLFTTLHTQFNYLTKSVTPFNKDYFRSTFCWLKCKRNFVFLAWSEFQA